MVLFENLCGKAQLHCKKKILGANKFNTRVLHCFWLKLIDAVIECSLIWGQIHASSLYFTVKITLGGKKTKKSPINFLHIMYNPNF